MLKRHAIVASVILMLGCTCRYSLAFQAVTEAGPSKTLTSDARDQAAPTRTPQLPAAPASIDSAPEFPDAPSARLKARGDLFAAAQASPTSISKRAAERTTLTSTQTHRFFDKPNLLLTSAEVAALVADGVITQNKLGERRLEVRYDANGVMTLVSVPTHYEADPLARPFVEAGWPGQIAGGVLCVGADIGLRYLLHRKNHHKAERLIPLILIGYGASGAIYGATH